VKILTVERNYSRELFTISRGSNLNGIARDSYMNFRLY